MMERLQVQVPAEAASEFTSPGSTFHAVILVSVPPHVTTVTVACSTSADIQNAL